MGTNAVTDRRVHPAFRRPDDWTFRFSSALCAKVEPDAASFTAALVPLRHRIPHGAWQAMASAASATLKARWRTCKDTLARSETAAASRLSARSHAQER